MKKVVVTRADDGFAAIAAITHPTLKDYARRCNADFVILGREADLDHPDPLARSHFRILRCRELLRSYDRLLSLDSDMIVRPDCPNLFDVVDEAAAGSVMEDVGSRCEERRQRIFAVQQAWGEAGWETGYPNTGTFICSQRHEAIFSAERLWLDKGYDDVQIGWQLHSLGFTVISLPWQYNHMSMFSEPWNGAAHRLDSWIVHYAGGAKFPGTGWERRRDLFRLEELITADLREWRNRGFKV